MSFEKNPDYDEYGQPIKKSFLDKIFKNKKHQNKSIQYGDNQTQEDDLVDDKNNPNDFEPEYDFNEESLDEQDSSSFEPDDDSNSKTDIKILDDNKVKIFFYVSILIPYLNIAVFIYLLLVYNSNKEILTKSQKNFFNIISVLFFAYFLYYLGYNF